MPMRLVRVHLVCNPCTFIKHFIFSTRSISLSLSLYTWICDDKTVCALTWMSIFEQTWCGMFYSGNVAHTAQHSTESLLLSVDFVYFPIFMGTLIQSQHNGQSIARHVTFECMHFACTRPRTYKLNKSYASFCVHLLAEFMCQCSCNTL